MPFDAIKYLGKQKKKRTFKDKMRIKWYAHKKQTARKYREWNAKYGKDSPTRINGERTWQEEKEYFSNKEAWKEFLLAVSPFIICVIICYLFKYQREATISILLLILYGIAWLIGIVIAFIVAKATAVFLYRQSVNIASNFVVDVLEEVDKKRAKRQDSNF
jgi:Na+/glutamate symporter